MSFDQRFAVIGKYKGYDREDITVSTTAIGFTASKLITKPPPKRAVMTLEGATIRYTYDGTDPTTDLGHQMFIGDILIIEGTENLNKFKAIRDGTVNGKLVATFER